MRLKETRINTISIPWCEVHQINIYQLMKGMLLDSLIFHYHMQQEPILVASLKTDSIG